MSGAPYRMFRRKSGQWYGEEAATRRQFSLRTRDEQEAATKIHALCEALRNPLLNRDIGRIYLAGADPSLATRTWQEVMDVYAKGGKRSSIERKQREFASDVYDPIRDLPINETRADHFLSVLNSGGVATNHYLRRIHNFARDMDWLLSNVIAKKVWPTVKHKVRKAVTAEQHAKIIAREHNVERRKYYELLWATGGSQTEIANLTAEDVDYEENKLVYYRTKKGEESLTCYMTIGPKLQELLLTLPRQGPLFPRISKEDWKDRAAEFSRRCRVCEIEGISLHSYRFAWAQRADKAGYPERYAMTALGHQSQAVHRHYAHHGDKEIPSLEDFQAAKLAGAQPKVIPFPGPAVGGGPVDEKMAAAQRLLAANPAIAEAILQLGSAMAAGTRVAQ